MKRSTHSLEGTHAVFTFGHIRNARYGQSHAAIAHAIKLVESKKAYLARLNAKLLSPEWRD